MATITQTDQVTFRSGTYRYSLKKYVAKKIYSVTGICLTKSKIFKQNTDYILENNELVWSTLSTISTPDANSVVTIVYDYDPVMTTIVFTDEQYGRDIRIVQQTNMITNNSKGDLGLATLKDNFSQAIRHRLLTQQGELYDHPDYGSNLPTLIGQPLNDTSIELARLYTVEAINQDPRVKDILDLTVTPDYNNKVISISMKLTTIVSHEPLNIVYDFYLDKTDEGYIYG